MRIPIATPLRRTLVVFLALSILLYPFLIGLLRQVMFETVQTDDYAPYLLYLLGHAEGSVPPTPEGYRVVSVLAAAPFTALPTLNFSLLPKTLSPAYLSATQAIALLSYVCLVATICLCGYTAACRFGCGALGTVIAGILAFVLGQYTAIYSLDMPAVLLVTLGVLALNASAWFAILMLASTFANEKVVIIFALTLGVRLLLMSDTRREHALLLAPVVGAVLLYVVVASTVNLPMLEHQQGVGRFLQTIASNLKASLSLRGLLLNVLPILVLVGLVLIARPAMRADHKPYTSPYDWLVVPLMLCIALVASLSLNLGRIVMHAFPLFVGPAALVLESRLLQAGVRLRSG
jgi:hypothetical protein